MLESRQATQTSTQISFNLQNEINPSKVEAMLKTIDIEKVTPIESINILNALKQKLDE